MKVPDHTWNKCGLVTKVLEGSPAYGESLKKNHQPLFVMELFNIRDCVMKVADINVDEVQDIIDYVTAN